jgi:oligopeptidase B
MRRPTVLRAHGHDRVDDFYWMNDRRDPAVGEFLSAENRYADAVIEEYARLRRTWEESWRASEPLVPSRPAFVSGGFLYEWQWVAGASQLSRRPLGQRSRRSQMVVDTSVYGARGLGFNQGAVDISPDHRRAAVAFERVGSERFTIRIRDIDRNRDLGYALEPVGPSLAWLDDTTLLYTRLDGRGIPTEVWRHRVGDHGDHRDEAGDVRLHQESDPTVFVAVATTASRAFAKIVSSGHSSCEVRLVPAGGTSREPRLVVPRRSGVQYDVEYHPAHGGIVYALVGDSDASRLLAASWPASGDWSQWRAVHVSPADQRAFDFSVSARHVLVAEVGREARLVSIEVETGRSTSRFLPDSGLPNTIGVRFGGDFARPVVWVIASGPANPGTYHQLDPVSGTAEVIYRAPAPRRFDPGAYVVEQWNATAPDGTEIPLSVFYSRDPRDRVGSAQGLRPAVVHGYGAYGINLAPGFSLPALTLADRGWVLAHAHVRGGGELGPAWHAAGRRGHKRTSVTDFVACAMRLANSDLVDASRLAARGGSAGGLLVCAATNERPDLFRAVVARVPIVDHLTSLLDPTSRLTQSAWDEFGNPIDDVQMYRYIASYSPYDNLRPCGYPAMLVTAAFQDARVPYWEPAKYVARLRATKTDQRLLLLRTAMQSGHSDRWDERGSEESYLMAFLASQLE